jgi:hypothetical protein
VWAKCNILCLKQVVYIVTTVLEMLSRCSEYETEGEKLVAVYFEVLGSRFPILADTGEGGRTY